MSKKQTNRLHAVASIFAGITINPAQNVSAHDEGDALPAVTVTANRWPADPTTVGSTVDIIDARDLLKHGTTDLSTALRWSPGIPIANTGARGSNAAPFMRGTESDHTLIVVDGVRISDANIVPAPFLGGAPLAGASAIEVLRGPQGSLYGSGSIGGVIGIESIAGEHGTPSHELHLEGGSFSSFRGLYGSQGTLAADSTYRIDLGFETTENDRSNNDFQQSHAAIRVDSGLSDGSQLTLTLRAADREYGSPGSIHTNDPDNTDSDETILATATWETTPSDIWISRLTFGAFHQELTYETAPGTSTRATADKFSLGWRNAVSWSESHSTILGLDVESTDLRNTGFGDINEDGHLVGAYINQLINLPDLLSGSLGLRYEHHEDFGDVLTFRAAAAYPIAATGGRIRGSVGSAFRAPSFFELYAEDAFFVGNPNLDPEESIGWDIGIEQPIGEAASLTLTYFDNHLEDLIATDFSADPASSINIDEANTQGVELSLRADIGDNADIRVAYTYLDTENEGTGERLLRRPHHTLALDYEIRPNEQLTLGLGAYLVQDRKDIDAATFATISGDDYIIARAHGRYDVRENLALSLRFENVLDEDYDEVNGFPGLPFGAHFGVTWEF